MRPISFRSHFRFCTARQSMQFCRPYVSLQTMKDLVKAASLGLLLAASAMAAGEPLLKHSPFLPPGGPAKPQPVAESGFEFVGVIAAEPHPLVSITRVQTKRNLWIAVGSTVDGIEVLSHDPAAGTVAIRIGGETKTLPLKKAAPLTARNPAPVPPPVASARPAAPGAPAVPLIDPPPPVTVAEKEREARMLVSDLLDIGMQQRKAYEEARRKAAAESAPKAAVGKPVPAPR